jgi:GntR family transcriptional regulator/MocR family aminotransferase
MQKALTSSTIELFVPLSRSAGPTLGKQIEQHLRAAIRDGTLKPQSLLPSGRDLAEQLKVSRPIVVDVYAQLASEGFITLRQGARPRVASQPDALAPAEPPHKPQFIPARYDLRPATPDLHAFPRKAWLRAMRNALETMLPHALGYDGRHGTDALRDALAGYLGRVRSVVTQPSQILVTSGFAQSRSLFCRAIAAMGGKRLAVEDPSYTEWESVTGVGLEIVPIPVDEDGIDVDRLASSQADAVLLTPTHHSPTGCTLSGERRAQLVTWLRAQGTFALEDDYDAEFRYDRAPTGAVQSLAPDRVVYAGTVSKTLAPALRMGWVAVPRPLMDAMLFQHRVADNGAPRIDQNALASFIEDGELDRHLRRMRLIYRKRRDVLISALQTHMPEAVIGGIAGGLHAAVKLPRRVAEEAILAEAARRGVQFDFMSRSCVARREVCSTMLIGYAQPTESAIRQGIRILAETVNAISAPPPSAHANSFQLGRGRKGQRPCLP